MTSSSIRVIALDTETTGLTPGVDRIIELAAVVFDPKSGKPTGEVFHSLFNPECEIHPAATAIHGKTWESLKGEALFGEKAEELVAFLEGAHIVIHNAPFDMRMLDGEFNLLSRPSVFGLVEEVTDTLAIAKRYSLSTRNDVDSLSKFYGIASDDRAEHNALEDCSRVAALYPLLLADKEAVHTRLNSILPFELDAELPDSLGKCAERSLTLGDIISRLEMERKRYTEEVKKLSEGKSYASDFVEVSFTNTTTTSWKKVIDENLPDIDLAPYQNQNSRMTIKYV